MSVVTIEIPLITYEIESIDIEELGDIVLDTYINDNDIIDLSTIELDRVTDYFGMNVEYFIGNKMFDNKYDLDDEIIDNIYYAVESDLEEYLKSRIEEL